MEENKSNGGTETRNGVLDSTSVSDEFRKIFTDTMIDLYKARGGELVGNLAYSIDHAAIDAAGILTRVADDDYIIGKCADAAEELKMEPILRFRMG